MRTRKTDHPWSSRFIAVVAVAVMTLVAVPATIAAVQPVEQIIHLTSIRRPPDPLFVIESRLVFPPGARWELDPEAGPVRLAVKTGRVGVVLGGGLARIERQVSPLQERSIHRLEAGRMASLWPGDTLVVVRGYQLRVDNDGERMATLDAMLLSRERPPALATDAPSGTPRSMRPEPDRG